MFRIPVRWMFSCLIIVTVGGCGLFPPSDDTGETGSPKLIQFSSEDELARYLSGEINARRDLSTRVGDLDSGESVFQDAPVGAPLPGADAGGSEGSLNTQEDGNGFSGTTLQEVGVDEADVVKTDGQYLYLMDNSRGGESILRIVSVNSTVPMSVVSETKLTGYGEQLYLYDGKVIALTSDAGFYGYPVFIDPIAVDFDGGVGVAPVAIDGEELDAGRTDEVPPVVAVDDPDVGRDVPGDGATGLIAPDFHYQRPRTVITIVDVSSPASPEIRSTTSFDGSPSSSRLIDGVLHLVVSNYESFFIDGFPGMERAGGEDGSTDTSLLLPTFTHVDAEGRESTGAVVTWEQMYRPTDPDGYGIVTVVSLDVDQDAAFTAVGIAAEPGLVYSSRESLYLTDTEYHFTGFQRESTDVYKFSYQDRGVVTSGTGTVPGRILNQYSMSEHDGVLRVASTIGARFGAFGPVEPPHNAVYMLRENDATLEVIGSVDGIAPGERVQSARFVGDRGYVVTFEEIDPLFTLDLSDATNPRVIGELKVPGFSTFIVPMSDTHLLTVGQYVPPPGSFGPWGVQVSIFDVSDFANPRLSSNMILGAETGAYSEAIHNPKAFTYFAERGLVAMPISVYDDRVFFEDVNDSDIDFVGSVEPGDSGDASGSDGTDAIGVISDEAPSVDVDLPVEPSTPYVPGGFEGLVVLSASPEGGLTELGRISTRYPESGIYWSSYTRGVFIDDDVCAVTNRGVRRTLSSQLDQVIGELVFDE